MGGPELNKKIKKINKNNMEESMNKINRVKLE